MYNEPPEEKVRRWLSQLHDRESNIALLLAEAQAPHDPARLLTWVLERDRNPVPAGELQIARCNAEKPIELVSRIARDEFWRTVIQAGCDAWAGGPATFCWTEEGPFHLWREERLVSTITKWGMLTLAQPRGDAVVRVDAIARVEVVADDVGISVQVVTRESGSRVVAWWPRGAAVGHLDDELALFPARELARSLARACSVGVKERRDDRL